MKLQKLYEKLYSLYRLFTLRYNQEINDVDTFIKYVYNMDILRLNEIYTPFIWEDYIFIDEKMISEFINKNIENPNLGEKDFDSLCEMDIEIADSIVKDNKINKTKYTFPISHLEILTIEVHEYYQESKENYFLFDLLSKTDDNYFKKLQEKKREVNLNKILN